MAKCPKLLVAPALHKQETAEGDRQARHSRRHSLAPKGKNAGKASKKQEGLLARREGSVTSYPDSFPSSARLAWTSWPGLRKSAEPFLQQIEVYHCNFLP